jgi:hypothetical protein
MFDIRDDDSEDSLQIKWECLLVELPFVCQISDFMSIFLKYKSVAPQGLNKIVRSNPPYLNMALMGKSV